MHMGGFKEFFLSCFLFPGLVIIYILSSYMYTRRDLAGRWTGWLSKFVHFT